MKKRLLKEKEKRICNLLVLIIVLVIIAMLLILTTKQKENPLDEVKITKFGSSTTVETSYTEEVLINPGKGLVLRDYFDGTCNDITSINYCRIEWSTIEPEKGEYNWNVIDEKIDSCEKRGKKFAFGVMNANSSSSNIYVTPKWVFDEGAQYYTYTNSKGVMQIIPKWTDTIFLEEVNNFINALSERYDGNPNIAFIDIRSYGNWGEQHLINIGGDDITPEQLQELYIKPYQEAFQQTLLVNVWGREEYNEIYNNSIDNGISIRRDGIMRLYDGQSCFNYAYGKVPTIFEFYASYTTLKEDGLWSEEKLLNYIEQWKPSYTEIWPEMYEDNPEFCKYIANKIGYYFRFTEAEFTNTIEVDSSNNVSLKFINEGVAPLYEDCTVYIGLLDENYNLVKKYKTDIDPHTWMPNEEKIENISITFDDIEPGNYIISLGLFLNENDENPTYLLGNTGKTDDKWYVFGELNITEKQEV